MVIGRVCGKIWATKKIGNLEGQRFSLVSVFNHHNLESGHSLVAVDNIGAGIDDIVLIATGSAARIASGEHLPVDAAIIGIVDSIEST